VREFCKRADFAHIVDFEQIRIQMLMLFFFFFPSIKFLQGFETVIWCISRFV
jgi:hypothetical protein